MKFVLNSLVLRFNSGEETIPFQRLNYVYGKMGAGKSSIARLIDYCLGGQIMLTPALQEEFINAKLSISLANAELTIERERLSDNVRVEWTNTEKAYFKGVISAREPRGEFIKGTGVETLSDLIFYLSGVKVPKVQVGKTTGNTDTGRISLRDMLWYSYLEQDIIDSSFFHLDNGPFYKKNKSIDVLRFVLGYHHAEVAALEEELKETQSNRLANEASYKGLIEALNETGVGSSIEIHNTINLLNTSLKKAEDAIKLEQVTLREKTTSNAVEQIRERCRQLSNQLFIIDDTTQSLNISIDNDTRHLNEISGLSMKFERATSAKAILSGVNFEVCPRCTQTLPEREPSCCTVCGQVEQLEEVDPKLSTVKVDVETRIKELTDIINVQGTSLANLEKSRQQVIIAKRRAEDELNRAMAAYDSAYLSSIILKQKEIGAINQQLADFQKLLSIAQKADAYKVFAGSLKIKEGVIREKLGIARSKAESDTLKITQLERYFKDCLIRSNFPGINKESKITISPRTFIPVVTNGVPLDGKRPTETTYSNVGSGGKKPIFKCCFAIAVHRLALELGAILPNLLIIDSPMKSISERENRNVFEGFYHMLYSLAAEKMTSTQFLIIDKELFPPQSSADLDIRIRHMTPDEDENPPLIRKYRGL
jgi:hypothetical protein